MNRNTIAYVAICNRYIIQSCVLFRSGVLVGSWTQVQNVSLQEPRPKAGPELLWRKLAKKRISILCSQQQGTTLVQE